MVYLKQDFIEFSANSQRVRSSLEQSYAALINTRRARADLHAFDELMQRPGGEPLRSGDEMHIPS